MDLPVVVVKILALVYLSAGVAALTGQMNFQEIVKDFEKSPALSYVTGFMTMIMGVLLVEYHNIWVWDWTVIVTIVGWLALLKGIMFMAFPKVLGHFKGWYKNTQGWGVLMLVLGVVFAYCGFIHG